MPQTVYLPDTITRLFAHWPALALVLAIGLSGCNEQAEIRSYEVPKTLSASDPAASDETTVVPKRIVAATLLGETQAWFFKVEGPPEAIEGKREEIDSFFESIVYPSQAGANPSWQTPQGWEELPASGMRMATLLVPTDEGEPLELTVTPLEKGADDQAYLLDNVNRWRGQIGLDPIATEVLEEELTTLEIEGGKLWVFDGTGEGSSASAMPPMMAGHPPIGANPAQKPREPASAGATTAESGTEPITYDLPDGWTDAGSRAMVLRVIKVESPEGTAELAISVYPVHGMMADPLSNINRWRGQVGLPPTSEEDLPKVSDEVNVSGSKGRLVTLLNPDTGEEGEAMIAAMVPQEERVWFLKLTGPRKVVEHQREAFTDWLKTVRMAEGNN